MNKSKVLSIMLTASLMLMGGCADKAKESGAVEIELVQYKPEAVEAFEEMADLFNETHDDIRLTVHSPNDAMTILKTRFIRGDYPDIVGIGGDMNYANFLDADMFMDISDFKGMSEVKQAYLDMEKGLELVPKEGMYALPYAANAAGILYNKDIFEEHGYTIPTTWSEFTSLCEKIQSDGITPLYFGFRDTWTTMAPWNALAVNLTRPDICAAVNRGETNFSTAYRETAVKIKELLNYCESDPFAYNYVDACTAFAKGQSAMYPIGSYAVPQILSVNPDMNIDSFVFPANENEADNVLNSGIDLHFAVMKQTEHKAEVYEVLDFLYQDETIQMYLDNQNAVPCKEGNFALPSMLDGMKSYIDEGRMSDFHDHHYPSEMSVDAIVQTYLLDESENATDAFLSRFDKEWTRYNRDIILKLQKYEEGHQ